MDTRGLLAVAFASTATALFVLNEAAFAGSPQTSQPGLEAALDNITNLNRPGQDGYATVWDGNKYVQCRRLPDRSLRCEAAGALMQTSLERVLTPDRIARLAALGWRLDPSFGNYVQIFPADAASSFVADKIVQVLGEAYDANTSELEVQTAWIRSEPCPPRNGPSQNLAGIVNDAASMAATAVHACAYKAKADLGPNLPARSAAELIGFYGVKVTGEIQRLRVNARRRVFVVLEPGIGYVQCRPDFAPPTLYCEAQSVDSWQALASVLTPERINRLHELGFADPGRAPNYSKTYLIDQFDDTAIAHELLTVLYDVYGYNGQPTLKVKTDETP
jgi:type III secretion system-like peptide-binding chaperone